MSDAIQAQINSNWNSVAASHKGAPHHTVRDEYERQVWLDTVRPLLPPPPADVLDIGTGSGFLAQVCADLGHRVTGVDLSEGMLATGRRIAAERANTGTQTFPPVFKVGNAADPDLPASSLDVVCNRNVLWTLLDPAAAFRNWWTLLRPGGRVLAIHGVHLDVHKQPDGSPVYSEEYTPEMEKRVLPLRHQPTLDPAVPVLKAAGFKDITIVRLETIERQRWEQEHRENIWLALTAHKAG